ncbi:hypothetical protein I656_03671 [Geobacillus sp. WSUCF1]|nr:hypothetical protein I656_03671 [Geobacillus sp. WSUCF1]
MLKTTKKQRKTKCLTESALVLAFSVSSPGPPSPPPIVKEKVGHG